MKAVKTQLKRGEIAEFFNVISTTNFDNPISSKFRYAVTGNVKVTKEETDEINVAFPTPSEYGTYQQERVAIFQKYKIKNDQEYVEMGDEIKKSLDTEITALDEKFKSLLEEMQALDKEKGEFLGEVVEIPIHKLIIDEIPTISAAQQSGINGWEIWRVLSKMIIEEETEAETEVQEEPQA